MREAGVEARLRKGQRVPAIVLDGGEHVLEAGRACLRADGGNAACREVQRLDAEPDAREVKTVAPLPGSELKQVAGVGGQEALRRSQGR